MAEESGEHSNRAVGWGIYDRLKKVPPFSSPKSAKIVLSPRGRKMDSSEKAAATAARRMVEDHFKQQDDTDAAEPLADFILIDANEFVHRGHKHQEEKDIAVCACVYENGDADGTCGARCLNVLNCTECTPAYCPCGDRCKNQRFQQGLYSKTKLVKTENKGWGLAVDEDLKAGDLVIEYSGEVITHREAILRAKVYNASGLKDSYIVSLNATEAVDGTQKGSLGRFINHSCEPNCEMIKWTVLGEDRLGIFATVDISSGKELTYDYKSQFYGGGSKLRCNCGAVSCIGFLSTKQKSLQQRDAYAWEDDAERQEGEEAALTTEAEDDAPLSSLFDKTPKKLKGVFNKGGGLVPKVVVVEKVITVSATPTGKDIANVAKESSQTVNPESLVVQPADDSPLIRRSRIAAARRWESTAKIATVAGKGKDLPAETRVRRGAKLPSKLNALEEEEIKVARKRARSDAEAEGVEATAAVTVEQILSTNLSKVAAFQRARNVVNKLLAEESSSCFPVSEAACAEVEFAYELEVAAASDSKKVCDDLQSAVKEAERTGQEVTTAISQKWVEAHCKKLRSTLNFHFSIVRHLAGPTYALSQHQDLPTLAGQPRIEF